MANVHRNTHVFRYLKPAESLVSNIASCAGNKMLMEAWGCVSMYALPFPDLLGEIELNSQDYRSSVRHLGKEERKKKLKKIQELFAKAREYSDDKVQIAMQMYEMVCELNIKHGMCTCTCMVRRAYKVMLYNYVLGGTACHSIYYYSVMYYNTCKVRSMYMCTSSVSRAQLVHTTYP